jgi:hypothetical protein
MLEITLVQCNFRVSDLVFSVSMTKSNGHHIRTREIEQSVLNIIGGARFVSHLLFGVIMLHTSAYILGSKFLEIPNHTTYRTL